MPRLAPRLLAPLLLAGFAAGCATVPPGGGGEGPALRPPSINFSPVGATRYALRHGCLPHIRDGRPVLETLRPSMFSPRVGTEHRVTSEVSVGEGLMGACTVRSRSGDPEALRAAVLEVLTAEGARPRVMRDSGPGSRDSMGDFRQESHCLSLNGRPGYLVMSTSRERRRPKLQLSIGRETRGPCGPAV